MTRATIVGLSAMLLCGISGSQSETRTFVIRVNADTVAVEHVTRTATTLTGDLRLFEEPADVHYVLHLRPDGSTSSADVVNASPSFFSGTIVFGPPRVSLGDSELQKRSISVPPDYLPVIGTSMGLLDYLLRLHARDTAAAIVIKVLNIRNRIPGRLTIRRLGRDSALVDCEACMRARTTEELRVGLAADGGIDGGVRVEQQWTIARR